MEDKLQKPPQADEQGKVKSTQNDSGLSFEEEPTGLGQDPAITEGGSPKPSRDSSSPVFTPGPRVETHSPFAMTSLSKVIMLVLAAVIVLAILAVWMS